MFCLSLVLLVTVVATSACTMNSEHPARTFADATGGEGMERVFWKNVAAANWTEIERVLATNYMGMTSGGTLDRAAALDQYRQWKLKDYTVGDLKTELNGNTFVVTYTITLNGSVGSQPLPATPQHMMTVWQQQKAGWVEIAHTVSQP
jgi:predicted alpha/beta hydrolase